MSKGYIPKNRKKTKHERRMRKKYKRFSCLTCAKVEECRRPVRYFPWKTSFPNIEFCPKWKASEAAKKGNKTEIKPITETKNKKSLIRNISKFFKK